MGEIKKATEYATIDVVLVTISPENNGQEYAIDTAEKIKVEPQIETEKAVKVVVGGKLHAQKPAVETLTGNQITLTDNVFSPELVQTFQGGTVTMAKMYEFTALAGGQPAGDYSIAVYGGYFNFTLPTEMTAGDKIVYDDISGKIAATIGSVGSTISGTISATSSGTTLTTVATTTDIVKAYIPPVAGSTEKGKKHVLRAYSAVYDAAGTVSKYECIKYPNCQGAPIAFDSENGSFRAPEYTINSAPNTGEAPYEITYQSTLPTVVS